MVVWYIARKRNQKVAERSKLTYKVMAPLTDQIELNQDQIYIVTTEAEWSQAYRLLTKDLEVYPVGTQRG